MNAPWLLTPRQTELLAVATQFGREQIAPMAAECDEQGCFPDGIQESFHATGIPAEFAAAGLGNDCCFGHRRNRLRLCFICELPDSARLLQPSGSGQPAAR